MFRILVFVLPFLHCIVLETGSWHLSSHQKYIILYILHNRYCVVIMFSDDFKSFIKVWSCVHHLVNHRLCAGISRFWLEICNWNECFTCRSICFIICFRVLLCFSFHWILYQNWNLQVSTIFYDVWSVSTWILIDKLCSALEINWN